MSRRRIRMALPVALAAVFALLLFSVPAAGTGAFWTTTTAGATGTAGTGQWCAAPDPSESGARFIQLSSIPTIATNQHTAIIPVANNTAWGGDGTGPKVLAVRLWGCQTAPVGNLRVTAWSNPNTALAVTMLTGTTVAPASRLNPASGLGAKLETLAQGASISATTAAITGTTSGDLRGYSWLISGGRTSAAPTTDPAACTYSLSVLVGESCSVTITNSTGSDATFAQLFNVTPWSTATITPTTYSARTWAVQTASGWDTSGAWLNVTCGLIVVGCSTNAAPTDLTATSIADLTLAPSANGSLLQWLVVQWTGATPAPSDLVLEVFLQ
jgi:hypothetical protein